MPGKDDDRIIFKVQPKPILKDKDLAARTQTMRIVVTSFSFIVLLLPLFAALELPLYLVPFLGVFAAVIVLYFFKYLTRFTDTAAGRRSWRGLREQLSGEIERIKYCKRQGQFDEALRLADEVLEQDPDFPEALYLKAQVLWEGFGNAVEARQFLMKVIQTVSKDDPLRRWALSYRAEITGKAGKGGAEN